MQAPSALIRCRSQPTPCLEARGQCHKPSMKFLLPFSASARCCTTLPDVYVPSRRTSDHSTALAPAQLSMRHSRRAVVTRASWGAPVEFKPAKIVSNKLAVPGMHTLLVDVGKDIADGFTKPGQYIQAKVPGEGKAGFFAIASPPDVNNQGVLEMLIKVQPSSPAEALCALQAGQELQVSPVQGKGFPVDRIPAAEYPTILMFATGSGISPIKSVIESGVLGSRPDLRLYYGTQSEEVTAYQSLLSQWQAEGVKVTQVFSGSTKRYVQLPYLQDVLAEEVAHLPDASKVGVLLCGHKEMCNAVTEQLKGRGVQQILMNF
ncbi:hypothetical protein QJQ45_014457 [Haematococcus lacustris]|nr:hypothetical protein QJQ45_014457 [Haematococcus lacustris]